MKIIITHLHCDLDGLASMIAASLLHPNAQIVLNGSPDANVRKYLRNEGKDLHILPERRVHMEDITEMIIVDTCDIKRLGNYAKLLSDKTTIQTICYDHHPNQGDYPFHKIHRGNHGACSSFMLEILNQESITINPNQATLFALGIYEDTGSFQNPNTTDKDFLAMAYLFSLGASLSVINQYINPNLSSKQLQLLHSMMNSMEIETVHGISAYFITLSINRYQEDVSYLVQYLKRVEKISLLICFVEISAKITVIVRSDFPFIKADQILQPFGGGGHGTASACTINNSSIQEIKKQIMLIVEESIIHSGTAKMIMSSHLFTVPSDTTLVEAFNQIANQPFSTIIVSDEGVLKGLLTKKTIIRLFQHGYTSILLKNLLITNEIVTAQPNDSIIHIQHLMTEKDIGRVPILDEENQLIGIITRSDILRFQMKYLVQRKAITPTYSIKALLLTKLSKHQLTILKQIADVADQLQVPAYLVGGCVRDILLGYPISDLDIVVEGKANLLADEFSKQHHKKVVHFERFNTSLIAYDSMNKIDVATARTEQYEKPGILPTVTTSTIYNDLYRRDFTINSMAVQINKDNFGEFFDSFGGRRDLQHRTIRILHNFSFIDDPTRILRAIRFEQRFHFKIDIKTMKILTKTLRTEPFKSIAVERITREFILACAEEKPHFYFKRLYDCQILCSIFPSLSFSAEKFSLFQNCYEAIIWLRNSFQDDFEKWVIYHIALLYDLSARARQRFIETLKYPNHLKEALKQVNEIIEAFQSDPYSTNAYFYTTLLSKKHIEAILYAKVYLNNNTFHSCVNKYLSEWRNAKLLINGYDLLSIGYQKGITMKKILEELLAKKLDGLLPSKDHELHYAIERLSELESVKTDSITL